MQDANATFVNFVANKLVKHEDVSAIFLYVAKAFDSINHDVLLHKLHCYEFRGVAHQWFTSYCNVYITVLEIGFQLISLLSVYPKRNKCYFL